MPGGELYVDREERGREQGRGEPRDTPADAKPAPAYGCAPLRRERTSVEVTAVPARLLLCVELLAMIHVRSNRAVGLHAEQSRRALFEFRAAGLGGS